MLTRVIAAAAAVTLSASVAAGSAQADPPPLGALHDAGEQTTEEVMQAIAGAARCFGLLNSWNATGSPVISPKGQTVSRPFGATQGRFAYEPFAEHGLTYAVAPGSTLPANLTLAQLRSLDRDGDPVTAGGTTSIPDVNIMLLMPQAGTGTRANWAAAMGTGAVILPAWVHDTVAGVPVQENDGVSPVPTHPVTGYPVLTDDLPVIGDGADINVERAFEGRPSCVCRSTTVVRPGAMSTIELYGFAQVPNCGDTRLRVYPNG